MFEGLKLGDQRAFETQRGWKDTYNALTYCTAEAVFYRKPTGAKCVLDFEFLEAKRLTGAPDCVHRWQCKWGTYVNPTDATAIHTIARHTEGQFGWSLPLNNFQFVGIVGPWLHKARATLRNGPTGEDFAFLCLDILQDQMEQTPFEAKFFRVDVTGLELPENIQSQKSVTGVRFATLRDLIAQRGSDETYLYWLMLALCVEGARGEKNWERGYFRKHDPVQYYGPGEHVFLVSAEYQ